MCGICGIIDTEQVLPREERANFVSAMNQALYHRGPDEAGKYSDEYCHLAMRRLAIIDLESGKQPVFNEQKNVCVFFNGEIYNFPDLKDRLVQQGHQFRTGSDTEVLVHLYEEHGTKMLSLLKGMFAFCLYDLDQRSFLLARDRFGEKPLYYHWDRGLFSFSSEIASLLEQKRIPRKLNLDVLPAYLRTSLVPDPHTLFRGIKSLPPGHYLQLRNGELSINAYFQLSYPPTSDLRSEEEAVKLVRPVLEKAVQRQTISDVPIGAFLSGGIDSSTVVALLQQQSPEAIKTFHVRFEDQDFDESKIARKVAEFCGTDHHEVVVPNYDFKPEIFWEIIEHVGLPFRDSSAIPTYLISKEIGQQVKVALSGDGGDELFGGYKLFQWYLKIVQFQKIPHALRSALNESLKLARKAPGIKQISKLRQVQRAVATSLQDRRLIPIALNEMFKEEKIGRLIGSDPQALICNHPQLQAYPMEIDQSPLREIMYYRMQHTLPANMLVKVDRMSMAHSLEVRSPFLDPDLFEVAARLPDDLLVRKGEGKYLIRRMMQGQLPEEVFDHPKKGFSIPLYKYQNEAFRKLARDLLFEESPLHNILDREQLEIIYQKGIHTHNSTATTSVFQSAHQLWMMMQLFGWARRFDVQL